MLTDTGSAVEVTVPLDNRDHGQLSQWFHSSLKGGHLASDGSKRDNRPPSEAVFVSANGYVGLIGCRWQISKISFGGSTLDEGRIVARRAILGAKRLDYDKVTGMTSQVPGLADWLGIKRLEPEYSRDATGRLSEAQVRVAVADDLAISRKMNLRVQTRWRVDPVVDGVGVTAPAVIATSGSRPRSWDDHLGMHQAMRELLELLAWKRLGTLFMEVTRADDPVTVLTGDPVGDKWCEVVSHELHFEKIEPQSRQSYLCRYDDIGARGVRRWLRLRDQFERAVTQFHAVLYQPDAFLETRLMNVGAALEAAAYQLAIEDGVSQKKARNEDYRDRLARLRESIPLSVLKSTWEQRSRDAFMAAKHSDAVQPPIEEQFRALGENILALRYWIARRLGASHKNLAVGLGLDSVVRGFGLPVR